MNIDLLFTREGMAGLISDSNLVKKAIGAVFDPQSGLMTLEMADGDYMELNIPVDQAFFQPLDYTTLIHLGAVKDGHIAQAYQIPLMMADDPYRNQHMTGEMKVPVNPLAAFTAFVRACMTGQPVHRANLDDDDIMGCVLGEASPASLEFAPHLARRQALEAKPQLDLANMPRFSTPGLGGGGGAQPPPKGGNEDQN